VVSHYCCVVFACATVVVKYRDRAEQRVGVGSTSHEKDTILEGKALSGARDSLFVWVGW
jgi:hypothetical protein